MELWIRRPTDFARCVANDAAGNVIETHSRKDELRTSIIVREIASTRGIKCELSTAASDAFLACLKMGRNGRVHCRRN